MTLDEILNTVAGSTRDDWNIIHCWGGGPSFLDSFSVWTGGADRWGLEHDQHGIRAAYRPDVSLGVAYGLDYMREDGKPLLLDYEWAKQFVDSRVTGSWVDVLWSPRRPSARA
jgi:hypothetical protein